MRDKPLLSPGMEGGKFPAVANGASNESGPRRATSGGTMGAFAQVQTLTGVPDLHAGVLSLCFGSAGW
jgi:hypothetical protein